jgi:hypothetical protein
MLIPGLPLCNLSRKERVEGVLIGVIEPISLDIRIIPIEQELRKRLKFWPIFNPCLYDLIRGGLK